ncbi:tetratricopeptide repeat protein [Bacteroides uniformis]|uniref:tetratricopeptide repeat-containing sensor histidine kinase n=1 Tax=Bacteroides uniformis TaxID=820 RepID=UPI001C3779C0|nr:histidine kinase [Bacteroides uniformis]MBV3455041.1 tetratricopeptide repeat protein [Bacteroides uniformis]MBV3480929.1 tetratricopeptide repeat protein [Bacteroides uniformis]MBV3514460.1 tetratricopeptide repeat protein [Bacteroides uniformis]
MGERMDKRIRFYIYWILGFVLLGACAPGDKEDVYTEMRAFEDFSHINGDSVAIVPRKVRLKAFQKMEEAKDSLVKYNYLAMTLKTYLITSQLDSAQIVIQQIHDFIERQHSSSQMADLESECFNMKGNIFARVGNMDSAEICFRKAYELRMRGTRIEVVPDILMNLADANNRLGKLDIGAAWYRRALLMCDSLHIASTKKPPIYYGLAQVYVTMRDFEQCDYYYNLAGESYDSMLPYEKYIYLNNRGTSYYYREDYQTAIKYFQKVIDLVEGYADMSFELNLGRLNLGDCYLQLNMVDLAVKYINECQLFFEGMGVSTALYYIDTQKIELALLQKDFQEARRLLSESVVPPGIDPDMVHIRNKYLQQFYEETGNYKRAYHYLQRNNQLDDSIRNERVRMRTADLTLRYQQDSTLIAHRVLLQEQKNKVLVLRQTQFVVFAVAVVSILTAVFLYLYSKKKRALLLARNHRTVSTLRLENIRNRLSPHFIFNVLNREMAERNVEGKQELSSLVKLMRRNLELAEQLCVTLAEELDFVKTYINLERRSLGPDFHSELKIEKDVQPEQIRIPSMMIQIPVENAVKHALREKESERNLWVSVCRRGSGICIKITDNGGGYRPDSRNRGTGTGMKVIMQTIRILNNKNKEAIDVLVHNVSLQSGEMGCEVTFWLPDNYDYRI